MRRWNTQVVERLDYIANAFASKKQVKDVNADLVFAPLRPISINVDDNFVEGMVGFLLAKCINEDVAIGSFRVSVHCAALKSVQPSPCGSHVGILTLDFGNHGAGC